MKIKPNFKKNRFVKQLIFSLSFLGLCLPMILGIYSQDKVNINTTESNLQSSEKSDDLAIKSTDLITIDSASFNKTITMDNIYVDEGGGATLQSISMHIYVNLSNEGVSIKITDDDFQSALLMMVPKEITTQQDLFNFMAQGINASNLNYYYPGGENNLFALLPDQTFRMILIPNGKKIQEPIIFNFQLSDNLASEYQYIIDSSKEKRDLFYKQKGNHYNVLYKKYHLKKDYLFSEKLNSKNFALQFYDSKMFYAGYFPKTIQNTSLYFVRGSVEDGNSGTKNIITNTKIMTSIDQDTLYKNTKLDYDTTNLFFIKEQDLKRIGLQVETYIKNTYGDIIPDSWTWKTDTLWDLLMFQLNGGNPDDLINAVQNATTNEIEVQMKNDPIPIIKNSYNAAGFDSNLGKMEFYLSGEIGSKKISSFNEWDSTFTGLSLKNANWILPVQSGISSNNYYGIKYDLFFEQDYYYYQQEDKVNAQLSKNFSNALFDENDLKTFLENMNYTILNQGNTRNSYEYQEITSLLSLSMTIEGKMKEHFIAVSEIILIVLIFLMIFLLTGIILLFIYRNKKETESILINPNYKESVNEIRIDS